MPNTNHFLAAAIRRLDPQRITIRSANRTPLKRYLWHSAILALLIAIICTTINTPRSAHAFYLISPLICLIALLIPNTQDLIIDRAHQLAYTLRGKQLYVTPLAAENALATPPIHNAKGWLTYQYGFSPRNGQLMQIASILAYQPAPNGFGEQLADTVAHYLKDNTLPAEISTQYAPLPSLLGKIYRFSPLDKPLPQPLIAAQLKDYLNAWQALSPTEQEQYYARISRHH